MNIVPTSSDLATVYRIESDPPRRRPFNIDQLFLFQEFFEAIGSGHNAKIALCAMGDDTQDAFTIQGNTHCVRKFLFPRQNGGASNLDLGHGWMWGFGQEKDWCLMFLSAKL